MGKGAAKFGYKSGTLPEVRQIFKNPIKPIVRPKNPNTGYADGIQHPKGTSREQPLPTVKTVEELISKTVQEPKQIPDLTKLNEIQKEKVTKSTLRREYYRTILKKEESKLNKKEESQQKKDLKSVNEKKSQNAESIELTLPTIESYLQGPIMRQRTPEETEILKAKREVNRLNTELIGKTNRATNLLELYYASEKFIINEKELEEAISVAFSSKHFNLPDPENRTVQHTSKFVDSLFNTIKGEPDLNQIHEKITGKADSFRQEVEKLAKEQHAKNIDQELRG
ncbi:hypothetical protein WICMUC_004238 [Wickerhamomyces mucosus]|uniref:Uncharacterized protein n=1 Tax=Wickerhamomyces mucosus TaxID=1378264 RepID=A0A9P8PJG1_9ASCO|nr:hypothetical protein WICMUC_004238 [Wickerhamomyces mucosus]